MKQTSTHVYFYTNQFSNWWSTKDIKPQFHDPITGLTWNNSEEAFMHAKAVFHRDFEIAEEIVKHAQNRQHPQNVKLLGRKIRGFNPKAWDCVCLGFMTWPNLLKYQQNADLAAQLKETGTRILVEASPVDLVWGVGLGENDPLILDERNWRGRNLLGQALMTVRGMI